MHQKLPPTHLVFGRREACLFVCMAYIVGLTRFSFSFFAYAALLAWTLYWPIVLQFLGELMEGRPFRLSRSAVLVISVVFQILALMLFIAAVISPAAWITGSAILCAAAAAGWDWCGCVGDLFSSQPTGCSGWAASSGIFTASTGCIAAIVITAVVATGLLGLPMRRAAPGWCYIGGAILLYFWPAGNALGAKASDLLRFTDRNTPASVAGGVDRGWGAVVAKALAILLILLSAPITGLLLYAELFLWVAPLLRYFAIGWVYIAVVLAYYVIAKPQSVPPTVGATQGPVQPAADGRHAAFDKPALKGDFLGAITLLVVVALPFVVTGELWLVLVFFHERQ